MVLLLVVGNISYAAPKLPFLSSHVTNAAFGSLRLLPAPLFIAHMDPRQQNIQLASSLPNGSSTSLENTRASPPPRHPATTSTATGNTTVNIDYAAYRPNASAPDSQALSSSEISYRNPFQPHKHYVTGRWHSPIFGLRRQADLGQARTAAWRCILLPYTIKLPGERAKRREELGLRVKGTGIGQRVKGKLWERTLKGGWKKGRWLCCYACYDSGMEAGMCGFFVWEGCTKISLQKDMAEGGRVAEIGLFTISGGFCTDTGLVCAKFGSALAEMVLYYIVTAGGDEALDLELGTAI